MCHVEPDILDAVPGGEAGGVTGEGDGLLRVGQEHMPGLGGAAVAQQLEHALGVDGLVPAVVFGLEAVGRELDEQYAGMGVVREEVIEGEVTGNGENGVGDGYVAGSKASLLFDLVGVDAGHGCGVAE